MRFRTWQPLSRECVIISVSEFLCYVETSVCEPRVSQKDPKKHVRQDRSSPARVFFAKQSKSFASNTGVVDRTAALARGRIRRRVSWVGVTLWVTMDRSRIATPSGTISCKPLTRNPSHAFLSPLPVTTSPSDPASSPQPSPQLSIPRRPRRVSVAHAR